MKSAGRLLLFILVMLAAETSGQVLSGSSFEGLRFPPRDSFVNGWASQQFWQIQPFRSSNWVQSDGSENYLKLNIKAHSGLKMALYTSNRTNSSDFMMTTPFLLNDSAICAKAVSFWIYRDSAFNTERLDVRINSTVKLSGSVLLGQAYPKSTMAPAVSAPGWYKYTFAIPSTYRSAPSYIFFNGISSSTGRSRIYMDDVSVEVSTSSPVVKLLNPYRAICPGGSTSFSISATGVMISYQWQVYNGSSWANIANTGIYSGAQTATLSLASATTSVNNYRYRCVVSNTCGSTISSYAGVLSVAKQTWYNYNDGDGWGSPYASVMDCVQPAGYVQNNLDCNDTNINNSMWSTVGVAGFSADTVAYQDMAIDASGMPYVVYADHANGNKATVKKYNGSTWITVGVAGFSAGAARYNQIAIDAAGTPYVVYVDSTNSNKATVKKYNGTTWVTVGSAGFSTAGVECTALAVDADGTPYVAYRDAGNSYKATVMKYNGTAWVAVGTPGFSSGALQNYMSIAINKAGEPYVAYSEGSYLQNYNIVIGKQVVVKRYTGNAWETVGESSMLAHHIESDFARLAIDASGTPYLAYTSSTLTVAVKYAFVVKFTDTSWKIVGTSFLSSAAPHQTTFVDIAIDNVGTPYIFYADGVSKYDGASWETVGGYINNSRQGADNTASIAVDAAGIPYIASYMQNDKSIVHKLELVDRKPVITAQPAPDTICAGNNATYKVAANNAYRYQWQVSTNGGGTFTDITNNGVYKGATTDSLTITAPAASYNNNKYRCVLTGTCSLKDTTAVAGLTINTPPAITSQPANKSICGGTNTSFSIAATGSGLTFRWKVNTGNGWANVPNSGIYSGVTSPTLVLTSVAASYSGYKYRCQVSGACAPAVNSAAALLTVNPKVTVTNPVMSPNPAVAGQALNTVYLGYGPSTVTLSSSATGGTPGYSYSWVPVSGLSNPMLATTSVSPPATTTYTLTATDTKGCKGSAAFTIKVIDARGTNNRVVVCHNDTSKSVVTNQVAAHLSHGDKLGPCTAQNKGMPNVSDTEDEEDNVSISRFSVLKVYPNPNTGRFIIELPVDVTGGIVVVTDMSGRSIKSIALGRDTKLEVDLGNVANGTYMVQVLSDDKRYRAIVTVKN